MKNTKFEDKHIKLGAKMVPFAGFNMPVSYTSVNEEHMCVRNNVGVFDVSHMGEIWIKGTEAFNLVQYLTSNDISKILPGQAQYNCFPNKEGGIVDDLIVYHYEPQKYLLVVNAANIEKDYNWIVENNKFDATIENASDNISLLAVQGPNAIHVLQKLTDIDLKTIPFYSFKIGAFAGSTNVIISATGYTGAGGYELYFYNEDANQIWEAIFEAGKEYEIQPIGLAARDTLRLEMGYCLYGNDIDDSTSPIEAGLGWITKFTEGNEFINFEALKIQKDQGVKKKLVALKMIDKGIPRKDYPICNTKGEVIGAITSGTMSPVIKTGIGLGYVKTEEAKQNTEVQIEIRNKLLKAIIVRPPFI